MELKLNKNSKVYKELDKHAQKNNMTVKEYLISDNYIEKVCDIIYSSLPITARFLVKKPQFIEIYKNNKEQIVSSLN